MLLKRSTNITTPSNKMQYLMSTCALKFRQTHLTLFMPQQQLNIGQMGTEAAPRLLSGTKVDVAAFLCSALLPVLAKCSKVIFLKMCKGNVLSFIFAKSFLNYTKCSQFLSKIHVLKLSLFSLFSITCSTFTLSIHKDEVSWYINIKSLSISCLKNKSF